MSAERAEMNERKWYQTKKALVVALLTIGPFALPLLWFNPRYSLSTKVVWTLLLVGLTYALGAFSAWLIRILFAQLGLAESGY